MQYTCITIRYCTHLAYAVFFSMSNNFGRLIASNATGECGQFPGGSSKNQYFFKVSDRGTKGKRENVTWDNFPSSIRTGWGNQSAFNPLQYTLIITDKH